MPLQASLLLRPESALKGGWLQNVFRRSTPADAADADADAGG
jgi:hypothetical protein